MLKKSSRKERRHYGQEFRLSAVAMMEEQGYTNAQAARELDIHENLLRTWRKKYGKNIDLGVAISGGKLNPMWVEWLMGFPLRWTDCEDLETPSSQT